LADSAPFFELGWNIYVFSAILTCLFIGGIPMPKASLYFGKSGFKRFCTFCCAENLTTERQLHLKCGELRLFMK